MVRLIAILFFAVQCLVSTDIQAMVKFDPFFALLPGTQQ